MKIDTSGIPEGDVYQKTLAHIEKYEFLAKWCWKQGYITDAILYEAVIKQLRETMAETCGDLE